MKKLTKYVLLGTASAIVATACTSLDLNPLDQPSKETWYDDGPKIEMALNTLLLHKYWPQERYEYTGSGVMDLDEITDDLMRRNSLVGFKAGTISATHAATNAVWKSSYEAITICNNILDNMVKAKGTLDPDSYDHFEGCARFYRACFYARIMMYYGDPVFFLHDIPLEEAYDIGRTPWPEVLETVYEEFDAAVRLCPAQYQGATVRATKGAAYAMKARTALFFASLYLNDPAIADSSKARRHLEIARDAAKACMESGIYRLHDDFGDLFLNKTHNAEESIFCIPRSVAYADGNVRQYIPESAIKPNIPIALGGTISEFPTWDLFCAFLCDDGLPIDKSPRYDPKDPFKNRDPRLAESIVEFGSEFCGVVYDPRFDVSEVWNSNLGRMVTNPDNMVTATESRLPSRTGLVQRKGIDKDWTDDLQADPDKIVIRYADVLLIYAEAKIELGEIDDTVLEAMNRVRARAYGCDFTATDRYPAITVRTQKELRTILRTERRMEFAFERLRYFDMIRWRISEKTINYGDWTLKYNAGNSVLLKVMSDGQWFIPTPAIDENGCPEMDETFSKASLPHITKLYTRVFNPEVHYLWPIPATDVLVNKNLEQNFGY